MFGYFLIYALFNLFFSCGPIYNTPTPSPGPPNQPNTHPELDSAELRTWKWSEISIPSYTWPNGTAFGNGLFVDIAHDPEGVKIEGSNLKFFLNALQPVAPSNSDGNFNYRSEIRTAPWQIQHPLGTEHWMGWSYSFSTDYTIDPTAPITIYQNHPGIVGLPPQFELEIAGLNRPRPAQGGEIQVVNHVLDKRFVTDIKPLAGQRLDIVVHVVYDQANKGLLQIWINGDLKYNEKEPTVFDNYAWGGNNKWGIYHHSHQSDSVAVNNSIAAGAGKVSSEMGTLRLLKRSPSAPNYRLDAFDIVKP